MSQRPTYGQGTMREFVNGDAPRDERYALCKRYTADGRRLSCYHTRMVHGTKGCQLCPCTAFEEGMR
jgi:hypothetical protein